MQRVARFENDLSDVLIHESDSIEDAEALAFYFVQKSKVPTIMPVSFPRASSLYKGCMRLHVLACRGGKKLYKKEYGTMRGKLTFDLGTMIHTLVQDTPVIFGDIRYGLWKCVACGKVVHFGKVPGDIKCPYCGAFRESIKYKEYGFNPTPDFLVSGHVDMFLSLGEGYKPRIVDVKTMKQEFFENLKAPIAANEFQVGTYMIKASFDPFLKDKVDLNVGYLCYVGKEAKVTQMPMKMYRVILTETLKKSIFKKERIFREGFLNFPEKLPSPQESCVNSAFKSYEARKCPALDLCMQFHNKS